MTVTVKIKKIDIIGLKGPKDQYGKSLKLTWANLHTEYKNFDKLTIANLESTSLIVILNKVGSNCP